MGHGGFDNRPGGGDGVVGGVNLLANRSLDQSYSTPFFSIFGLLLPSGVDL